MNPALILIVEDDATVAANLEDTLVQIGYRVAGLVSTGDAAVKAALELHPDAILMDIHLRGEKDGIQAAAEIQQQSDIPVVYLTAYSDETLIGQAKKANGFSYLTHPVDERELRANLEMTLYKSQLEKHILHLNQVLHAIRDVHKLIIREHQPQRLLEESCNILVQTRGYHFVLIGQLQEGRAVALASAGEGNALMELITRSATRQQAEMLPATEAMRTKQVVICADMANDERYAPWRETIKNEHFACAAAIPMLYEGEERGVLCIFSQVSTIFDNEETDMVLEIAGDIAFALKTIEDEISLQKSQALYRQLVENTNDLVCEVDQEGRFTYLNPQYEQVLGYTPQELLGTKVSELGHREEENTRKDKYAALLETQSPSRETWRFRHKNGEWHWLECSGMVFEKSPGEKAVSVVSWFQSP